MCVSTWRAVQAEGKNRDVTVHGARESAGEAPGQVGSGVAEWWQGMKARKQNYEQNQKIAVVPPLVGVLLNEGATPRLYM